MVGQNPLLNCLFLVELVLSILQANLILPVFSVTQGSFKILCDDDVRHGGF